MVWTLVCLVAQPFVRLWLFAANRTWRELPRPTDSPRVSTAGADPDRILLMGNGAAVGYGVLSYELALPGALARQISRTTGRAVEIDVVPDAHMMIASCIEKIQAVNMYRYDCLILTVGVNETMSLSSARRWRMGVERLLDHIETHATSDLRTFLIGVPPMNSISVFPASLEWMWNRHARRLNAYTRRACSKRERIAFVPFVPERAADLVRYRSKKTYDAWSGLIAPAVSRGLSSSVMPTES